MCVWSFDKLTYHFYIISSFLFICFSLILFHHLLHWCGSKFKVIYLLDLTFLLHLHFLQACLMETPVHVFQVLENHILLEATTHSYYVYEHPFILKRLRQFSFPYHFLSLLLQEFLKFLLWNLLGELSDLCLKTNLLLIWFLFF